VATESPAARPRPAWIKSGAAIVLAALTIGLYLRGADHEFVSFDDFTYVTRNPGVLGGLSADGVAWAFTTDQAANWHPVTWLSHMLDVELYGLDAGGHHVTNAILHGLGVVVLLLALVALTGAYWPSFFVAAIFALHPLRVESVAWISERKDLLAGLFAFSALWAHARYVRRPGLGRYALVALALALSLMSKPMAVTLPFVLLLLDVWPLRRTTGDEARTLPQLFLEKLPLFAIVAASSIVTVLVQRAGGAVRTVDQLGFGHRFANAFEGYGWYAWKFVWPTNLACFYPHAGYLDAETYSLTSTGPLLGLAFLVVGCGLAWALRRRIPAVALGWLWFLGTLVPMIGLLQVGQQATADRYTYLPLIGLTVAAVWTVRSLASCCRAGSIAAAALGLAVIGALIPLTWNQIGTWKNSVKLYEHALAVTDRNYTAHNNYGVVLEELDDLIAAEHHYRKALEIQPEFSAALINLGKVLHRQGELAEARELYERALEIHPGAVEAHNNLGVLAMDQGDYGSALGHLERALRSNPDHLDTNKNLYRLHSAAGNWISALPYARKEVELSPQDPQAAYDLGAALFNTGQKAEARSWFERALELDPGFLAAAQALSTSASEEGRTADAIATLKKTLDANPQWANGFFELARIQIGLQNWEPAIFWLKRGLDVDDAQALWADQIARILQNCPDKSLIDLPAAIRWAHRAVELTAEQDHRYLSTLAYAYATAGDFDQAIVWQTKALDVAPIFEKAAMQRRLDAMRADR